MGIGSLGFGYFFRLNGARAWLKLLLLVWGAGIVMVSLIALLATKVDEHAWTFVSMLAISIVGLLVGWHRSWRFWTWP